MSKTASTQVAVIGGGPGGYAAAFMAADLGLEVTLIDVEKNPGGACLYRGCIPSKALLHVARVIHETEEAAHFGLHYGKPKLDLDQLRTSTNAVISQMTGGLGQLVKARKISYIQGRAAFLDAATLSIFHEDGSEADLGFEYAIIATGSRPARFGPLIDSPRLMNSTGALALKDIPKRLLIIGGGYIGLELGSVYAALGAKITLVEMTEGVIPGLDRDLVKPLTPKLEERFEAMYFNTKVSELKEAKNGIEVTLEGPEVNQESRIFDKVLVSVGRKPNVSGLNLKATNVEVDERGFIQIDVQRRTAEPNIFAIGDVAGGVMLAHKASYEGRVAAEVIAGKAAAFEPMAIPAVVFTDPEIATAGLTEAEARRSGRAIEVSRFPWAASGRAATLNRSEGLTKLIFDAQTEQLLGMGITGVGAGEMIAEGVLAIEMGAVASDLDMTMHPHPTLSETVMESAAALFGHATHFHKPRR